MAAAAGATFPNDPILVQLLRSAKRCAARSIVVDTSGFDKTYNELLADVLATRDLMRRRLPPSALDERGLLRDDGPYVSILSNCGYELAVAFFAVRAIGGACIPLASSALPEEAAYFVGVSKSSCLLAGRGYRDKAHKAVALAKEQHNVDVVPLVPSSDADPLEQIDIQIDESLALDHAGPGLVIFTSGTTGKPKGVVLPRRCLCILPDGVVGSETISFRPPHWLGGLMSFITPIMVGTKVYAAPEQATAEQLWDLFLSNSISTVSFTPTILRSMMEHLEAQSPAEQERLLGSLKLLTYLASAGSMLSSAVLKFWSSRTNLPFMNVYGSTEVGGYSSHKIMDGTGMTNCVGWATMVPGIDVKLSEGDHGEFLVKSPFMMISYLGAEEQAKHVFDKDGYLKTGDRGELRDGDLYFCGRAAVDYAYYQGICVPTLQVEMALSSLPYVSSAWALAVPALEAKEICGAVVLLTPEARARQSGPGRITLQTICEDLRPLLPRFMQPVILRFIQSDDEMPLTPSHKPIRKLVVKQCFGIDKFWDVKAPSPGVEWRDNTQLYVKEETKTWDWGRLQFYQEAQT